jgi:hypothetical protein
MGFMGRRVRGAVRAFPLGCAPIGLLQETGGSEAPGLGSAARLEIARVLGTQFL